MTCKIMNSDLRCQAQCEALYKCVFPQQALCNAYCHYFHLQMKKLSQEAKGLVTDSHRHDMVEPELEQTVWFRIDILDFYTAS